MIAVIVAVNDVADYITTAADDDSCRVTLFVLVQSDCPRQELVVHPRVKLSWIFDDAR